nr:FecR domain-containing protein [Chitinophaga nivalis]
MQVLDRYFKNECSPEEREMVTVYLNGEDHTLLDEFLEGKWREAEQAPTAPVIPPPIVLPARKKIKQWTWTRYAAVLIGIMVMSATAFYKLRTAKSPAATTGIARQQWKELDNRSSGVKSVIMGDGTKIWLNRNAVLRYPDDYNTTAREVELIGEAYFEVAKDKDRPFRVYTANMVTTALGTSFNISSFITQDTAVCVSLLEGKVSVAALSKNGASTTQLLTPGMVVNFEDNILHDAKTDRNIQQATSWIKDKIYFDNTTLKDVCRRLSYQFNEPIAVEEKAAQQRVSGTFNATDDLITIMNAIAYLHKLEVSRQPEGGYRIGEK